MEAQAKDQPPTLTPPTQLDALTLLEPTPFPQPNHYFLSRSRLPSLEVPWTLGEELEAS